MKRRFFLSKALISSLVFVSTVVPSVCAQENNVAGRNLSKNAPFAKISETEFYDFTGELLAAQNGNAVAQYRLYYYYATVLKNHEEAEKWLRKSAESGYGPAQGTLGGLYVQGDFGSIRERDAAQAFYWWGKAAEQGISPARASLALFLLSGVEGVCKANPSRAVELMKDAATAGFAPAQAWLGKEYLRGELVEKNEILGTVFLRAAADQGDPNAQGFLALHHYSGGNAEEALLWAEKAAEQGNASGEFVLGCANLEGVGVPVDIEKGFSMMTRSADHECWLARAFLTDAYLGGMSGVPKNREKGEYWLGKSVEVEPGDEFNPKKLAYFRALFGVLCKDAGKTADAVKWLKAAADAGQVIGQYELARIYYYGRGVPADKAEAARLFRLAAEQGHAVSQFNLAVCLINGEGVPANREEALKWAKKAAECGLVPARKMLENESGNK